MSGVREEPLIRSRWFFNLAVMKEDLGGSGSFWAEWSLCMFLDIYSQNTFLSKVPSIVLLAMPKLTHALVASRLKKDRTSVI